MGERFFRADVLRMEMSSLYRYTNAFATFLSTKVVIPIVHS